MLRKEAKIERGPIQRRAFDKIKEAAITAPVLAFFQLGLPTFLETDASKDTVAGALMQTQTDGSTRPVGYFSKTMSPAETSYPIQDRELLAVVRALDFWRSELIGIPFTVVTDHEALKYFSTKRALSTRQARWAYEIADFNCKFVYRPGKQNVIADALSRKTADSPTVKARQLEARTMEMVPPAKLDVSLAQIEESPEPSESAPLRGTDLVQLIEHESNRQAPDGQTHQAGRLFVPLSSKDGRFLRTELVREAHEPPTSSHPGRERTYLILRDHYQWPNMKSEVSQFVRNCSACRRNKVPRDKAPGLLHPLPTPSTTWEHVQVDGKDMPPDRRGYNYVWTFVDKLSRTIATLPGRKSDTAEHLAQRYYYYLFRLFGVPVLWLTDRGAQFMSAFIGEVNRLTGTKHKTGSAYHPQTQGGVEIMNQELDQWLWFYVSHFQDN